MENGLSFPLGLLRLLRQPVSAFQISLDIPAQPVARQHRRLLSVTFLLPLSRTLLPQVDSKALQPWPKRASLQKMGIPQGRLTALPLQDCLITSIRAWQMLTQRSPAHQVYLVQTILSFRPCWWEKPIVVIMTVGWWLLAQRLTTFTRPCTWAPRCRKTLWPPRPALPCLQPHLHPNPQSTTPLRTALTAPNSTARASRTPKAPWRWILLWCVINNHPLRLLHGPLSPSIQAPARCLKPAGRTRLWSNVLFFEAFWLPFTCVNVLI